MEVSLSPRGIVARLPRGLDEPVGASGTALSPAEAQHLALARVILADRNGDGAAAAGGKPVMDAEKCVYCTLCAKKCPQEAIRVDRKEKIWELDEEKCVECGICAGACPKKAIEMKG